MTELEEFRARKDEYFRHSHHSPLTEEQRAVFDGLRYYPENPALRVRGPLDQNVAHATIEMDTSSGDHQTYTRAGKVTFQVDGQECVLYLYRRDHSSDLFLPFRDATSGKETYGGGRYLDISIEPDGQVQIDFNYAYNPMCAYDDGWSCPIPPVENWLSVPIRAGELASPSGHTHDTAHTALT
ncbi:MAG: DUF1684 domain-containing protein [Chloroflexi bacterium]|nr:DUF1684 domain-containing protein [Chloroflexota bacterium]